MSFEHSEYLLLILFFVGIFIYFLNKLNKKFYTWVEDHWFFKKSRFAKLSFFAYGLGVLFLALALMDLRGKEESITGKESDQKTIILVDTSASMMAEDVRPNRFEKSLLLVKHFIKKSVGHHISIIAFSDGSKRIVPFTEDKDLLLARVDTLKTLDLRKGGTGLSKSIKEAAQYFVKDGEATKGNILVFTDGEETGNEFPLELGNDISVGVVAVGTAKGAPVPERDKRGIFRGNKKHKGKLVISKLDEDYLKSLSNKTEQFKYWVASSYSIPTTSILSFFNDLDEMRNSKNTFKVKPVKLEWLMIPGLVFLALSFLFNLKKNFVMAIALFFIFDVKAQQGLSVKGDKEEERQKSERTLELEKRFRKGTLSNEGKKALAAQLLKEKFVEESAMLYEEVLEEDVKDNNIVDKFNESTALLQTGNIRKSITQFQDIIKKTEGKTDENSKQINETAKLNVLKFLESQAKSKQSKSKDKQEQKNDQQDDKDSNEGEGEESKEQKDKQEQEGESDEDKEKEEKDQKAPDQDQKRNEKKTESAAEREKRKKNLPQLLKQLISDDNKLQKKLIDAKTSERKDRTAKDW